MNGSEAELDENDDMDDELQDLSDVDLDFDDDMSEIEFNDNSDNEDVFDDIGPNTKNKRIKKKDQDNSRKRKSSKGIDSNIFVSAEKFAEMLEQHGRQKSKHGGTDMYSTVDGASSKQIDWEVKRHDKLRGSLNRNKRKGSKVFKRNVKKIKR